MLSKLHNHFDEIRQRTDEVHELSMSISAQKWNDAALPPKDTSFFLCDICTSTADQLLQK
jgi:hypothetical protein